jgi:hypothetical protein
MANLTAVAAGGAMNASGTFGGSTPTAADNLILASTSGNTNFPNGATCPMRSLDCMASGNYTGILTVASTTAIAAIGDATPGNSNTALRLSPTMTLTLTGVGTFNFVSTSTTQQTIITNGKICPTMLFSGAKGNWILGDNLNTPTTADVRWEGGTFDTGNFAMIGGRLNFSNGVARTITLGSSAIQAWSISYGNMGNVTLTANTAVVTVTGTITGSNNVVVMNSFNWNGLSLIFNNANQATINIAGATIGSLTINGVAAQDTFYRIQGSFTCTGTFTVNGNSEINRVLIYGINYGGPAVTITAGATSLSNVDFQDIRGAGAASWTITSGVVGDRGGNSNIQVTTPTTQTRDSTNGQAWSVAARWTSRVPLPQDNVIINASSGNISATDVLAMGKNIDFTGYTGTLTHTSNAGTFIIFGSLTVSSGMSFSGAVVNTFNLSFAGRGTHTIDCAGKTIFPAGSNAAHSINSGGGTYNLASDYNMSGVAGMNLNMTQGTFNTNNYNINTGRFLSAGVQTRNTNLGTSTINMGGTATASILSLTATNHTFSADNATFNITSTTSNTRTIDTAGLRVGTLNYTLNGSTGNLSFGTSSIINLNCYDGTNSRTIGLSAGAILTVINFNVYGASGRPITIQCNTSGNRGYISKPYGGPISNNNNDYLILKDIHMIQPLSFFANNTCTDNGNNNGIYFGSTPTFKHQQSSATAIASSSVTTPLLASTTPGNALLALVTSTNTTGGSETMPPGWTLLHSTSTPGTGARGWAYMKVADGTETSVTYSQATSRTLVLEVIEYSGFTGTPILDATDAFTTASTVSSMSTSAGTGPTNTRQPALAVAFWSCASALAQATGITNGFAIDYTPGNQNSVTHSAAKELTSLGAVETNLSWGNSRSGVVSLLIVLVQGSTFKPRIMMMG